MHPIIRIPSLETLMEKLMMLSKEVKYKVKELRKVLNSFNLMPGSASDDFDSLNHQIINHLSKGSDQDKIKRVLLSELIIKYGLYITEGGAKIMAKTILLWWTNQNEDI